MITRKLLALLFVVTIGLSACSRAPETAEKPPEPTAPVEPAKPVEPPKPALVHETGEELIAPGTVELYPTYSAVGIELPYTADINGNASASFSWRHKGQSQWHNGVDMTIDRKNRFIWASIWPLEPGETVEVKITLADPDPLPGEIVQEVTTLALVTETSGGRTLYVSPEGDDNNPGTQARPFKTIQHAQGGLRPGDTLLLASGVYAEGNLLRFRKGTPEQPIVIAAAPGAKPVLDSSHEISKGSDGWQLHADDVYVLDIDAGEDGGGYLAQDGKRSFFYNSLEGLLANDGQAGRSWHYDAGNKKLYVRTGLNDSPSNYTLRLSRHTYGVYLEGSRFIVVKGLTIRNYGGACVRISGDAYNNIIIDNVLHNAQGAVFIKDQRASNNAIWRNEIFEPGLSDFGWGAIKGSDYGRQGVQVWVAGRGNSVCYNKIHGWFDGVNVEAWQKGEQFAINRDSDTMFNEIYNIGDDAIEHDGGGVNMRVHGNRVRNAHSAFSFAPIERGPVYVTRNEGTYHTLLFKLSVSTPSPGHGYFYHNSGYAIENANKATMIRLNVYNVEDQNKVFKNNAMIGSEFSIHRGRPNNVFDGNSYYHTPAINAFRKFDWNNKAYTNFESFQQESGQEANGMYADPQFVSTPDLGSYPLDQLPQHDDTSTGDLRLMPTSPCIDAGVPIRGINEAYKGAAPDIGAHEFEG